LLVSIVIPILSYFLLGGLPQRLVEVGRVAKLAVLGRVDRLTSALVGDREAEHHVPWSAAVLIVALLLHSSPPSLRRFASIVFFFAERTRTFLHAQLTVRGDAQTQVNPGFAFAGCSGEWKVP
jgi:hypothetical protein